MREGREKKDAAAAAQGNDPKAAPGNPLRVYCHSCGAPARFDIARQTYRCAYCGGETGIAESRKAQVHWRKLHEEQLAAPPERRVLMHCPSCGAEVAFQDGGASETCAFCGSKLIRRELEEERHRPDLVIPFVIRKDEARQHLQDWARTRKDTPEGKAVLSGRNNLQGYYLPYCMVRGPVSATVERRSSYRSYYCDGYLDGLAVNTNRQLDNLVLDKAEPFDWTGAKPFAYGYIAGHPVKLNDLSGADIRKRIEEEVTEDFRPVLEKVMHTSGLLVTMKSFGLDSMNVLLPVYFFSKGKVTAVVNGQTGRIAVSAGRVSEGSRRWIPGTFAAAVAAGLLMALLVALIDGHGYYTDPEYMLQFTGISLLVFFPLFYVIGKRKYGDGGGRRIILTGGPAQAWREHGKLHLEAGGPLSDPKDPTPVFREKDESGKEVPVHLRFYPPGRVLSIVVQLTGFLFAPALIAIVLHLIFRNPGEPFFAGMDFRYGAAWYIFAFIVTAAALGKSAGIDVFDYPYVYEIRPDGSERLTGTFCSRWFTVLRADDGDRTVPVWRLFLSGLLGAGLTLFIGAFLLFLLLGSISAIGF